MRRCAIIFLLWLCAASALTAQPWWEGNRVSPMYFGPNALPVPDMLDGRVAPRLYAELAGDIHKGFYGDMTETVSAEVNIPLFTPRVNLSVWMPVVEFYHLGGHPRVQGEADNAGYLGPGGYHHGLRGRGRVCALLRCSGIFLRCLGR